MRYAKIRKLDVSNGDGIGVALFVQGCHFHCKGCFNKETWDFDGGKEFDEETENHFFDLISKDYIERVSILGGEPLCDENVCAVYEIVQKIKTKFPTKKIWLYTGYQLENMYWDLQHIDCPNLLETCRAINLQIKRINTCLCCDFVVDGQFKEDLKVIDQFKGSSNQRIWDISKLKENDQKEIKEKVTKELEEKKRKILEDYKEIIVEKYLIPT